MPGGVHRANNRDGCVTDLSLDSSQITLGEVISELVCPIAMTLELLIVNNTSQPPSEK